MKAQDAIRSAMDLNLHIIKTYFADLDDADLLRRPGDGCNHLAWQLGHLIASAHGLLNSIRPGEAAELPPGFAEQYNDATRSENDPGKFHSKQQYVEFLEQAHAATTAALGKTSEDELDRPGPEKFRAFLPTVGSVYLLLANHPLMHAGQFVPVRRALGKPVVI